MRIVLIGGQSVPGIGGIESYVLNLGRELIQQKHKVTIICSDRNAYTTTIDGIDIVHLVCPKSNIIAIPLLFLKSLGYIISHRKDIDVINFQSILFAFISGWIARLCNCKVCYTIHSLAEDNPKHNVLLKAAIRVASFVSIYCCGKRIITVSNSKASEIKQRYGRTCTVIPCGVNRPQDSPMSDILKRFGISSGHYYLTIGRMDPIKNLDTLIQAFIDKGPGEYQLVLAGDYSNNHGMQLRNMAQEHKNIIFVGPVMGDDKEYLLAHSFANCLVSSSEGMPLSLLEAMSYNKPCIVSDIPAIREVLNDDWGLWCAVRDVNSLIEQMTRLETHYNEIIEKCPNMSAHVLNNHTWDRIAERYTTYLLSL